MTAPTRKTVILASASPIRATLLRNAGIEIVVRPVRVDEESVRLSLIQEGARPREIAEALSELKAQRGAASTQDLLVAADQIMAFENEVLGKPKDPDDARQRLQTLRGQKHELISAVCVALNGSVIWRHIETAQLWMRDFSDDYLDSYLERNAEAALRTVGGYELEAEGIQLFSRIEGDYFTILGLPVLPVLSFLREHGALPT